MSASAAPGDFKVTEVEKASATATTAAVAPAATTTATPAATTAPSTTAAPSNGAAVEPRVDVSSPARAPMKPTPATGGAAEAQAVIASAKLDTAASRKKAKKQRAAEKKQAEKQRAATRIQARERGRQQRVQTAKDKKAAAAAAAQAKAERAAAKKKKRDDEMVAAAAARQAKELEEREQAQAAGVIQTQYKAKAAGDRSRAELQAQQGAALKIQSAQRGKQGRAKAKRESATLKPPPEGWQLHVDGDSGQHYYHEPSSGTSVWERPAGKAVTQKELDARWWRDGDLVLAVGSGDIRLAVRLIEAGCAPMRKSELDKAGRTVLAIACSRADKNMAELLLRAGADPNVATESGSTPLMYAARSGIPVKQAFQATGGERAELWLLPGEEISDELLESRYRPRLHAAMTRKELAEDMLEVSKLDQQMLHGLRSRERLVSSIGSQRVAAAERRLEDGAEAESEMSSARRSLIKIKGAYTRLRGSVHRSQASKVVELLLDAGAQIDARQRPKPASSLSNSKTSSSIEKKAAQSARSGKAKEKRSKLHEPKAKAAAKPAKAAASKLRKSGKSGGKAAKKPKAVVHTPSQTPGTTPTTQKPQPQPQPPASPAQRSQAHGHGHEHEVPVPPRPIVSTYSRWPGREQKERARGVFDKADKAEIKQNSPSKPPNPSGSAAAAARGVPLAPASPTKRKVVPSGGTPLMFAAAHGEASVVRLLLKKGADRQILTATGKTALMFAERAGHEDVADLLRCPSGAPQRR